MKFTFSEAANLATALAVVFAAWQIWLSKKQAATAFEDALAREYRELAARLPTKALLGEELSEDEYSDSFDELYHYLDLCNEQAFLAESGRISKRTCIISCPLCWSAPLNSSVRFLPG